MMRIDSENSKPESLRWLEYALLMLCLCVLAVRATYPENPHIVPLNITEQILGNDGFSVIISTVLIFGAIAWCIGVFLCGRSHYRFSGIEIGVAVFLIAAVVAIFAASNKRAAITDSVTLIAPMLMALLLIQILDSPAKIKLVLFVIVALAAAGSFQCFDQLLTSNQYMIDDYEKNPADHIERAGFEPNSFEHMLYEHRLYSKDIRGFFTTSNSAGSFAILATFAAVGLCIEKIRNLLKESSRTPLTCCAIVAALVAAGLVVTQSKGAIVATAIAAIMLGGYLVLGGWLGANRKVLFAVCAIGTAAGLTAVVWYGMSRGYLPGGNSMLVRWQYWAGAMKVYAAKPFTGVGGGNFATYYTHYKLPEALETVRDPHNFVLTLLSQYGPLGLIGFVSAFGCALYKTIFTTTSPEPIESQTNDKSFKVLAGTGLALILAALLVFRPILMAENMGESFIVIVSVALTLYFVPAICFGIAFLLLWLSEEKSSLTQRMPAPAARAAIFCGIVAVLIHNLIDFAIFEPGVLTCFWAMVACLVAVDFGAGKYRIFVLRLAGAVRIFAIAASLIIVCVYCNYALVPAVKSSAKIQQALRTPNRAVQLLAEAATDDKLSPGALNLSGRLHQQYYNQVRDKRSMLSHAAKFFEEAIQRDKADFKNFEKLMTTYELLATVSPANEVGKWTQKAYDSGTKAALRYPGKGRLQFELGEIAERTGDKKAALVHYEKAVQIEDSYRTQFRRMYPGREMFSRLGQNNYACAKEQITQLKNQGNL
ncbi:MAG: O-antigen ligase family protein [Planctomycetota bacterium]|jgi:hypothetical protein